MAFKGRHWVMLWLLAFLVAAGSVVARQTAALRIARALNQARDSLSSLQSRRADFERRLRQAASRTVLVPRAQALGLRLPADSEIVILPVPDTSGP
ncbi:MAG TPA: hypothetical protein VJT32_07630 [bacterium]|nr:hypothetical protein [bacterium]HZH42090.1 hypothetical protein [Gemmatimonadales bacterium]